MSTIPITGLASAYRVPKPSAADALEYRNVLVRPAVVLTTAEVSASFLLGIDNTVQTNIQPAAHILTCQNCGAPLEPEPGADRVRCGYCQVTSVVDIGETKTRSKPIAHRINKDFARLVDEINRLHERTLLPR